MVRPWSGQQVLGLEPGKHSLDGLLERGVGESEIAGSSRPVVLELSKAEHVTTFDDEGVDLGKVQTRLDDRGCHHDVVLAVPKVDHHLLELSLRHLSVSYDIPGVGHQLLKTNDSAIYRLNTIVDIEDLALSEQLASNGRGYGLLVVWPDVGEYRMPVFGWSAYVGNVADPRQSHFQRPRDGRRGKREHVHTNLETFDRILRRDAKALFFIDHQQSQALEVDVLG